MYISESSINFLYFFWTKFRNFLKARKGWIGRIIDAGENADREVGSEFGVQEKVCQIGFEISV